MIRLIQFGNQRYPEEPGGADFAFLDTVTDTFVTIGGEQVWDSRADLEGAAGTMRERERFLSKLPDDLYAILVPCPPELAAKIARAAEVAEQSVGDFVRDAAVERMERVADGGGR